MAIDDNREKIVIERKGGKMVVLTLLQFDTEVDVDDILRIDYGNIMGEILTFPVIFNRVANLKAEMDSLSSETKLDFDIFESSLRAEKRKEFIARSEKPTVDSVEDACRTDPRYKVKKQHLINTVKDAAYLEALYWSAQSKDSKLNRISEKIRPEEFEKELIETAINGVMIKNAKNVV